MVAIPTRRSKLGSAVCGTILITLLSSPFAAGEGQWLSKPPPPLPFTVLEHNWQGTVVLKLVFEPNGQVKQARLLRSSRIRELDELAQEAAMTWRLRPELIKPSDLTTGRFQAVIFRQAGLAKAVLPGSVAFWRERAL